ncbi:Pre-mRNA-splicing factor CWC22 like protein [Atta colombica]|uniref:Pre-mRNA-splicing factor CWC22 like protein n=1 Tax=Atta colombica TaxID=520822 RepID=A0A195BRY2_9HYME|nr:Pre-mRNA-splicing factor CWC22 like protein [Atta colombica]
MKKSHSRKDEDKNEEMFINRDRKHDDFKELKHNGDHRNSRHHNDHRSSRRNDEHKSSKRDSDRNSQRDDHGDRKYNDDREDLRDSDGKAGEKRNSPQEEIGNRYYGEPDKARENPEDAKQKRTVDILTSKIGGAYIPPTKLRMLQTEITDKSGAAYQRIAWEALKKSIHGYINKVNTSNIGIITHELLRENIVRGRDLLTRSIIQAQAVFPTFTPVYKGYIVKGYIEAIFEMLKNILLLVYNRSYVSNQEGFKDHEAVPEELDLVEEEHQITHLIRLDDEMEAQDILNVFKFDADYLASEEKYKQLCKDISDSEGDEDGEEESSNNDSSTEQTEGKEGVILDNIETNLLDCCAEMRTYEKFFGLIEILRAFTDSILWSVLLCIKLNEEDTMSSNRIFIKILFKIPSEASYCALIIKEESTSSSSSSSSSSPSSSMTTSSTDSSSLSLELKKQEKKR